MEVRFYIDPETGLPHCTNHGVEAHEVEAMNKKPFPPGWDERRIRRVIGHYESQTDDDAVAEDEAAEAGPQNTFMEIPTKLVPAVRELLAKQSH